MVRDNLTIRQRRAFAHLDLEMGKPLDVCIVKDCHRKTRPDQSLCNRHVMQEWRRRHPESAQYSRLKSEARKRKLEFTITREEWAELCRITRYHEKTGQEPHSLTIDRIYNNRGYTLENIRVTTQHENGKKGSYEMQCRLKSGRIALIRAECIPFASTLREPEDLEKILERI